MEFLNNFIKDNPHLYGSKNLRTALNIQIQIFKKKKREKLLKKKRKKSFENFTLTDNTTIDYVVYAIIIVIILFIMVNEDRINNMFN